MNAIQNTSQTQSHRTFRTFRSLITTTATATALVVGLGALPAAARQDPGPRNPEVSTGSFCPIQRVGTQFVACDNLTGNGVPAPAWVDER